MIETRPRKLQLRRSPLLAGMPGNETSPARRGRTNAAAIRLAPAGITGCVPCGAAWHIHTKEPYVLA